MLLVRLWRQISTRRRIQLGALTLLITMSGFAEMISLGSVLPFLGALVTPEKVYFQETLNPIFTAFGYENPESIKWPLTLFFCIAAVTAGLLRVSVIWISARLAHSIGADIGAKIFERVLFEPLINHVNRNSSLVVSTIVTKANSAIQIAVSPVLNLLASLFVFCGLVATLLIVEPLLTIYVIVGLSLAYGLVALAFRLALKRASVTVADNLPVITQILQEAFGAIKDVLLYGKHSYFISRFQEVDVPLRRAQGTVNFIMASPRYVVESLMIVLVALGSFFVFSGSVAAVDLLPVVGLLLLAGQKILPIMQVFYGSYSNLVGGARSLEDAIEMMEAPKYVSEAVSEHLVFKEAIKFCNVGLKYFQRPLPTLSDINLTIKKGECVGIVGKTGCGKSTLANIFLGLLWPSEGYVEVDGKQLTSSNVKSWQKNTAYVAQDVFLSDATICKNVAFGAYDWEIDLDEVHQALNGAMLQDLMSSLPNGIETHVGERGVQLSGGQRQRLGIARALYRKSNVLVLDEASSALDNETELAIMQTIATLKERMTILIVAHRHTSLMACDRIIMLEDGAVVRTGTPAEILGNEKL